MSAPDDVADWLEDRVDDNLQTPGYQEHPSDMALEAGHCRGDAQAAGIDDADLIAAAGGNLEQYLLRQQNSFTDSEVRRKAEKDD
jgi:hypothetical protein